MGRTRDAIAARLPSTRTILGYLHLWVGLILGIPLILIGLTGSVLVFEHELTEWLEPAPKATSGMAQPLQALIASAIRAQPDGTALSSLTLPESDGDFAVARFSAPGAQGPRGGRSVRIDPVSLATEPLERGRGPLASLFMLHAQAFVPGRTGRVIIGWFGVAMLALGLSGLYLWWPRNGRWKQAFSVKWNARALRLNRDLHGAFGIWSLLLFLVVTWSGVYLSFPTEMGGMVRAVFPARDFRGPAARVAVDPVPGAERITLVAALGIAQAAVGDAVATGISFPAKPEDTYRVQMQRGEGGHGVPGISVFVDPWRGTVAELRDPRDYTIGETILAWQHALHAGAGLGWTWKILVFVSGLLPALFFATGMTMWWLKRQNRRRSAAPQAIAQPGE
jgi:uncharacterized iron-regulated membrane protein